MKFIQLLSFFIPFLLVEALAPSILPRAVRTTRPVITVSPKTLAKRLPLSSAVRNKTCVIKGGTADDSAAILSAFQSCNNGGHVIFSAATTYTIGKPLNLTFLKSVDWDLQGTIKFTNNTDFWQANSFKYAFQSGSSYWAIGGSDVNIYGGGLIDGGGQLWWDLLAKNSTTVRPLLFNVDGLNGGTISNIRMQNPGNWFNLIQNSQNVVVDSLTLTVATTGTNPAKNTDGWDTYRSSNIVIQNSNVDNTDDCVSFKPNSTSILVQNLHCNGSHGVSVGSLGQYVGVKDIAQDIYVYNVTMTNSGDAARIKVFPGAPDSVTMNAGGGSGYVKNVTYSGMHVSKVDWAIEVTGCYTVDVKACALRPPIFLIEDVLFENFDGVTSTKYSPKVATVSCPNTQSCVNVRAKNFQVVSPKKTNDVVCSNVNVTTLGLNCTSTT